MQPDGAKALLSSQSDSLVFIFRQISLYKNPLVYLLTYHPVIVFMYNLSFQNFLCKICGHPFQKTWMDMVPNSSSNPPRHLLPTYYDTKLDNNFILPYSYAKRITSFISNDDRLRKKTSPISSYSASIE